jgi:hypothetical protein
MRIAGAAFWAKRLTTHMELQQRCWNHEAREAACRCPACGRSYCRECVSEHEGRLLCAACLGLVTVRSEQTSAGFGKLAPPGMIAAGILLAWLIYWAAGASLIGLIRRLEQEPAATSGSKSTSKGRSKSSRADPLVREGPPGPILHSPDNLRQRSEPARGPAADRGVRPTNA